MRGGHPSLKLPGSAAEEIAECRESAHIGDYADAIVKDELRQADPRDGGERSNHRVNPRHKFREDQRTLAVAQKALFRMTNAGVRFEGNAAKELQDLTTSPPAEEIPQDIAQEKTGYGQSQDGGQIHLARPN